MKRKNTSRNALFTSIISLLLCVSMLVGTTFAWFTDEVKSGTNVIAAGNLDVELYHSNSNTSGNVDESTVLFVNKNGDPILWEPGAMAYETLTVKNEGSLALKYNLAMNLTNENFVVEADGTVTPFGLSNALKIGMIQGELADDVTPEEVLKQVTKWDALKSFQLTGALEAHTAAEAVTFVIYWEPSDNDNNWNVNNGKTVTDNFMQNGEYALHIDLGVHLKATQQVSESDSFGPEYDKLAPWTGEVSAVPAEVNGVITITTGAELAALAADVNSGNSYEGKTIQLGADINLNDVAWTPIGTSACPFKGTFIGTGYTISNLYAVGKDGVGLFGRTYVGAHIEGVTVVNAYVYGNDRVGVIVGGGYLAANCIKDCTVMNAVVTATPYMTDDGKTYDGGAKAGVIIGQAYNGSITGCTAKDASVTAYRDLGGISGMLYADGVTGRTLTASGNTVENVTLTYLDLNGAAYDKNTVNESMGDVVGRLGRSSDKCNMPVVENNTVTNVTRNTVIYYEVDGISYSKDVDTGDVVLLGLTANFEGTVVTVPANVSTIGAYAFSQSSVETVILNEGLKRIENRAFQKMPNMTSIVIPSTVEFIGEYAFQASKLTTLEIPESVTRIDQAAFAYSTTLETIIINGSPVIGQAVDASNKSVNFVARACPNLKTVVLAGDDITFATTGITFSNTEGGLMENITFYAANETVKTKLLAATNTLTAEKVLVGVATDAGELNDVLANAQPGDKVVLTEGTYTFPNNSLKEGVILECLDGVIFEGKSGMNINGATVIGATFSNPDGVAGAGTINGTFKDCVFEGSEALRWCYSGETVVFENCEFKTDFRGVHFDGMDHDVIFRNCKINGFNAFGGKATVTFEGCTFGYDESYYNGLNMYCNTVLKDCKFEYRSGKINFIDFEAAGKNLTIENCTATMNGEAANVIDFVGGTFKAQTNITVDSAPMAFSNADLTAAIANGAEKVFLPSGTYVVPSAVSGKTVTIVGNGETVIDITTVPTYAGLPGATITFENVVIKSDPQDAGYNRGFAHTNKITYNNCVINGTLGLNTDTEFNNCTFNISGNYYNLWTWGASNVALNGCTINSDGKAVLLYGTANTKLTVNGCTFNDNGGLTDLKAAIEIGNDYNKSYELIVNNTAVNGYEINDKGISTGTTLWANKNSMGTDKLNVVVDGVDVY